MPEDDMPRPEAYVPRWPDLKLKPERFWSDVERAMVAQAQQRQAEWDARQEEAEKREDDDGRV